MGYGANFSKCGGGGCAARCPSRPSAVFWVGPSGAGTRHQNVGLRRPLRGLSRPQVCVDTAPPRGCPSRSPQHQHRPPLCGAGASSRPPRSPRRRQGFTHCSSASPHRPDRSLAAHHGSDLRDPSAAVQTPGLNPCSSSRVMRGQPPVSKLHVDVPPTPRQSSRGGVALVQLLPPHRRRLCGGGPVLPLRRARAAVLEGNRIVWSPTPQLCTPTQPSRCCCLVREGANPFNFESYQSQTVLPVVAPSC